MILLTIVIIFICLKLISCFCPNVIYKRDSRASFTARNISHRGGAGENIENTLHAFKHAMEVGSEMLELDVHLTKDQQVIVFHDSELHRTLDTTLMRSNITVEELNYAELPIYKPEVAVFFSPGQTVMQVDPGTRKVPTLEQIFREFPGVPINLDVKVDDDLLIESVAQLIERYERESLTVWGSFSTQVGKKLYQRNPRVSLFFPFRDALKMLLLYHFGLFPFVQCPYSHLELPSLRIMFNWYGDLPWLPKRILSFLLQHFFFSRRMIKHFNARGIPLYVWVCNEEEDIDEAFTKLHANAVMTDYPSRLTAYLDKIERTQHSPLRTY